MSRYFITDCPFCRRSPYALRRASLPLIADVRIDQEGNAAGTVEVNGTTIANIAGTGFELSFTWTAGCVAITR